MNNMLEMFRNPKLTHSVVLNGGIPSLVASGLEVVTLCPEGGNLSVLVARHYLKESIPTLALQDGLNGLRRSADQDTIIQELSAIPLLCILLSDKSATDSINSGVFSLLQNRAKIVRFTGYPESIGNTDSVKRTLQRMKKN